MNKMTYKEFEKEMMERNIEVYHAHNMVLVIKENTIIATVPKWSTCRVNTNALDMFDTALEEDRIIVAKLCWALASTPLSERKELKKYRLRVKPQYQPFFSDGHIYLRKVKYSNMFGISDIKHDNFNHSIFTEDDLIELSEKYDLSLFEKVEVEDD